MQIPLILGTLARAHAHPSRPVPFTMLAARLARCPFLACIFVRIASGWRLIHAGKAVFVRASWIAHSRPPGLILAAFSRLCSLFGRLVKLGGRGRAHARQKIAFLVAKCSRWGGASSPCPPPAFWDFWGFSRGSIVKTGRGIGRKVGSCPRRPRRARPKIRLSVPAVRVELDAKLR